jgi:hypothetical protein
VPLTHKGRTIKKALVKEYGKKRGTSILFAGKNSGKFTGIDADAHNVKGYMDACARGDSAAIAAWQNGKR